MMIRLEEYGFQVMDRKFSQKELILEVKTTCLFLFLILF